MYVVLELADATTQLAAGDGVRPLVDGRLLNGWCGGRFFSRRSWLCFFFVVVNRDEIGRAHV